MPINEQLSFSVSFGGNVKASASATINDTSRPAYEYMLVGSNPSTTEITEIDIPTYTLASNKTSVNEGETIIFTLSTTMLDTGTVVPYTITGVALADLSSEALTGSFTTDATGKSVLQVQIANDQLTEGTETLTLTLNGKAVSKSVTINDTSVLVPTYNVGFVTNMTVKLDPTTGFDPYAEPGVIGDRTNRYSEGDFYVSRDSNGWFQLLGAVGTIVNPNVVLSNWSFRLFSWYVNTVQSCPSINLVPVSGTPPNTFYAKFGDTSYTFTRQPDVSGRLVYHDATKGIDNGFKYIGISTRLNFALTPV